jgi:hypothetical protein
MRTCEKNMKIFFEIVGLKDKIRITKKLAEMKEHAKTCDRCLDILEGFHIGLSATKLKILIRDLEDILKGSDIYTPKNSLENVPCKGPYLNKKRVHALIKYDKEEDKMEVRCPRYQKRIYYLNKKSGVRELLHRCCEPKDKRKREKVNEGIFKKYKKIPECIYVS